MGNDCKFSIHIISYNNVQHHSCTIKCIVVSLVVIIRNMISSMTLLLLSWKTCFDFVRSHLKIKTFFETFSERIFMNEGTML